MSKEIPLEFYNPSKAGKPHPEVRTVGDLIKQLKRLPKDMPLSSDIARDDDSEPAQCIVYNHGYQSIHFTLDVPW